ncbi:hypothetical protein BC332_15239 [Capsicum chinense]|nr:hypothetical protein BC332_15239 [Capsicum chinense]
MVAEFSTPCMVKGLKMFNTLDNTSWNDIEGSDMGAIIFCIDNIFEEFEQLKSCMKLKWNLNPLVHLHNSLVNLVMMLKLPSQLLPQAPKSPASAMSSWAKTLYFPQPIEPGQQGLTSGDAGTSTFSYFASGLGLPFTSKASEANNCAGSNSPTT